MGLVLLERSSLAVLKEIFFLLVWFAYFPKLVSNARTQLFEGVGRALGRIIGSCLGYKGCLEFSLPGFACFRHIPSLPSQLPRV